MSKLVMQAFSTVVFFGSFGSMFAWAFFGVTWWTPFDGSDIRGLVIYMFHMFGLIVPVVLKGVKAL